MLSNSSAAEKITTVDPIYSPRAGTIIKTIQMTEKDKFFEVKLDDGMPLTYQPGQFVQLSIFGIGEAPISLSSSPTKPDKSSFEICVRMVGVFTRALHNLQVGDKLGIRGAYGRPFPLDELKGNDLIIIAGGLGIVPLRSLINFVVDRRRDYGNVIIRLGCKRPTDRLFTFEMAKWEQRIDINYGCTIYREAPNWKGSVGVLSTLIPGIAIDIYRTYAVMVGHPAVYRSLIKELLNKGIPENRIILSLERRMKCGLGKCGHCQLDDLYVCKDGPTFTYAEVKGLDGAL